MDSIRISPGGRAIYWSSKTGAYAIYGEIKKKYDLLGGVGSFLGYPTAW
jgi:uncharacterized protein with LGFP repeats